VVSFYIFLVVVGGVKMEGPMYGSIFKFFC